MKQSIPSHEFSSTYRVEDPDYPKECGVVFEDIQPRQFEPSYYHHHASIEMNYLHQGEMTYSFSGNDVTIKGGVFTLFWGANPHRVLSVNGAKQITNVYISLSQLLQWNLPSSFISALLSGSVICARENNDVDLNLVNRWVNEHSTEGPWHRLHALEVEARLLRLATEGWSTILRRDIQDANSLIGGKAILHFEAMLRFMSEHFSVPIGLDEVADNAGVSKGYAMSLFKKLLGKTIKEHLTDLRLYHAKMLLAESDTKIVAIALDSGFGSLSAFYDVFQKHEGISPAAFRKRNINESRLYSSSET
ncbi:putative Melibiose operon regulatory protein [Vibrio nigripulchritudo MADA3029]|uniref:helix-turn-helix domain-containing protein n=1 Tax=Vibrio nigripulchritudo TaxID=28173 RepID=UPI0003B1C0D2|nr:helix-turn-helix domain-containing protein [Vibrio nigripulchritudo]CCN49687.1 putative Melibiose operon regulatory protein [Vibrio nigripulchritudo MADA3020]CCN52055.1 putative Melibiose operon regulatory protein [Vibrio nigripulchritudo MADA3021]CCN59344.1 putative Melibiose operon regulatory protein [Vibrio nigripulchritudo MADA3029]